MQASCRKPDGTIGAAITGLTAIDAMVTGRTTTAPITGVGVILTIVDRVSDSGSDGRGRHSRLTF